MAVTDSYVTAAEYRLAVGMENTTEDASLLATLAGVSRLIDRQCGRFFTVDGSDVKRYYEGNGSTRLYVDDFTAFTSLKVDLNGDYAYGGADETLAADTHFWVGPVNAALGSEPAPYVYIDLVPNNGRLSVWPAQPRAVELTATFGWPAIPGAIKEATIALARQVRDLEASGYSQQLQTIDQAILQSPDTARILRDIVSRYKRQRLFV